MQLVALLNVSPQHSNPPEARKLQALNPASVKHKLGFPAYAKLRLAIQQKGIDICANNQKLASQIKGPSQQGLAIVAMAQITEMMQVKSLTGTISDTKTLDTLVKEVQDRTNQNIKNIEVLRPLV
ncbi:hypothetical protein BDV96DRAFT_668777 [Lophiotrema nucula]|uniref:Uncharacterized protein n=1 Tax=Lophiotrema nucula TaxID=690887 RepID=A0A6A5YSX1_9PLEO|nr:hypothetical protein BDV96DRAFT_668777 [Lophiotrema nucula]